MAFRGLGPTLLPRPVELTHYLSEPLYPPKVDTSDKAALDAAVDKWHAELTELMNTMLEDYHSEEG